MLGSFAPKVNAALSVCTVLPSVGPLMIVVTGGMVSGAFTDQMYSAGRAPVARGIGRPYVEGVRRVREARVLLRRGAGGVRRPVEGALERRRLVRS